MSAVVFMTDLKGVEGGAGGVGVLGWPGLTTLICSGLVWAGVPAVTPLLRAEPRDGVRPARPGVEREEREEAE